MIARCTGMIALVVGLLVPGFLAAQSLDRRNLVAKQETQKRVRKIAADVVASILDVQIQQLEDNRLTSLDIYRDVKEMRQHVNLLVANEMPEVVDLLGKIQGNLPDCGKRPAERPAQEPRDPHSASRPAADPAPPAADRADDLRGAAADRVGDQDPHDDPLDLREGPIRTGRHHAGHPRGPAGREGRVSRSETDAGRRQRPGAARWAPRRPAD